MPDDPTSQEKIFGLDPRALLGRAAKTPDFGSLLRAWTPPTAEELGALLPQFEVLALLGRGGMGAVYRARQSALDRFVAIKLLPESAAGDPAFGERFRLEARTLARFQHPHIVAIHDFGQTTAGHLYFVMEYIDGADLAQVLAADPPAPSRALEIVRHVCEALQYAHERGVVHRDVKPANVLLARNGTVKVADFGLARLCGDADSEAMRLTQSGMVVGTLDYLAPEQHEGREVDARADLYSVGVLLYQLLTGQLPRGAWSPPSQIARVDPRLDSIVRRALDPDPRERFASAAALSEALVLPEPSLSRRTMIGSLAAATTALGLGTWWWNQRSQNPVPVRLLAGLDLAAAVVSGEWRWLHDPESATLVLAPDKSFPTKLLRLPARPAANAYDFSFQLFLASEESNAGAILRTGATRAGILFNYFGSCGMGMIRGKKWDENETLTKRQLPVGRWNSIEIAVRPEGADVSVIVRVDGDLLLRWTGLQSDLALFAGNPRSWEIGDAESLGFASDYGGLQIREARMTLRA